MALIPPTVTGVMTLSVMAMPLSRGLFPKRGLSAMPTACSGSLSLCKFKIYHSTDSVAHISD